VTAPTQVAPDQARHDYIARVYKMTHAELFAELMRVHTEANRLVEQAVKDEREACIQIVNDLHVPEESDYHWIPDGRGALKTALEFMKERGQS
jgi:hypothetical protein